MEKLHEQIAQDGAHQEWKGVPAELAGGGDKETQHYLCADARVWPIMPVSTSDGGVLLAVGSSLVRSTGTWKGMVRGTVQACLYGLSSLHSGCLSRSRNRLSIP